MVLDCEGLTMKSRMGIIGRGYLPIGKSPIFNGQKDKYESSAKSVFTGYVFNSENQRLSDGGRVALLRKAQAHPDYEKYMKLASSR
jgi:hypothetical protein